MGTTKDTPIETLQFMLKSPTNANQIEACRSMLSKFPTSDPLHRSRERHNSMLARMGQVLDLRYFSAHRDCDVVFLHT